jgi:hypothetical protein
MFISYSCTFPRELGHRNMAMPTGHQQIPFTVHSYHDIHFQLLRRFFKGRIKGVHVSVKHLKLGFVCRKVLLKQIQDLDAF